VRTLVLALLLAGAAGVAPPQEDPSLEEQGQVEDSRREQASLHRAALALPIAAGLSGLLAFRPRRRGHAPPRSPEVVQTQIMLSLVGALVMLVVGASLARAFGIAGAAGLVRYRAKVSDAKDASVMLSALGIGLAAGVGLFWLAIVATLFIVAVLWLLEHLEPRRTVPFDLRVHLAGAGGFRPHLEALLRRHHLRHHLRTSSADEVSYEVDVPFGRPLEPLSEAIMAFEPEKSPAIEWQEKKPK
jgi:hypothetical protein